MLLIENPIAWLLEEIYKHIPDPAERPPLAEYHALFGEGPIAFPRLPHWLGRKLLNRWLDYQDFYALWAAKQFHLLDTNSPIFAFFLDDWFKLTTKLSTAAGYEPPDASFPVPRITWTDRTGFDLACNQLFFGWETGIGVFPVEPTYEQVLSYWLAVYVINAMHIAKLLEVGHAVSFIRDKP